MSDLTQGLESTGATVTSHQIVTVNGRKAIQFLYDLPLTNGGTDLTVHGTAYVFVTKDTVYIVTIIGKTDVVDQVTGGTDLRLHGTAYFVVTKDTLYNVTIVGKPDVVEQVISTFVIG